MRFEDLGGPAGFLVVIPRIAYWHSRTSVPLAQFCLTSLAEDY